MKRVIEACDAWFSELGDALVEHGAPFTQARFINPDRSVSDGGATKALKGYTIISAATIEEAVAKAMPSPVLDNGGTIEVLEVAEADHLPAVTPV